MKALFFLTRSQIAFGTHYRQERLREHRQRDVSIPTGPTTHFVLVEPGLLFGLGRSLTSLMQVDVAIPDYMSLAKRAAKLEITLDVAHRKGSVDVVVDSTGLKALY